MGSSGQEEAPGIFWAWVEAASGNMALALTTLVEQVQSWVKGVGVGGVLTLQPAMDTLGTLLVGWMIFVTLILILGTFFYFKFIHNLENESSNDTNSQGNDEGVAGTSGSATQSKAKSARKEEPARKPTIVPEGKGDPVSSPVATGADPDAVKWASNVFTWLYNSAEGGKVVSKIWLDTINENTVKTAIETGILVEVVELMKQTPSPVLTNMVVDCSPTDNVTITCDCDATLYMRIITTRTQGDHTTESEYACAVTPLRGRLNIAAVTAELLAVAKFDGWPEDVEVSLTLEGIRNNATGRDEQQMMDVINEVITSALRNSVLEINFQPNQTFPRFRRARQIPDPIIPVGYDSMVREKQTHPPSVPRKTPKADFVPLHNEKIEAAGESFTALTFSNLTSSEEQLITRNLNKYPSLENAEMEPEEIEEFCKNWQENYVPAADVPPPAEDAVEEPPSPPTTAIISDHPQESEAKNQNFVLMVSSRSKLIDEPRNSFVAHDVPDEEMNGEEEELADIVPQARPRDEPCLRKETGSPLLLATPKQDSFGDADDDEFEDAKLQFDRLEILDKPQISSTLGIGPLHKGSFVSEACCVGVQVGVAAQVPQLDFRIETAAVGGSVACDLPEYDQEASTRLPLPPSLHNQPSTATTPCPESCVDDVTSEPEESSSPSPIRSLSPEPFIPSACGVFQLVDDSNNESGIEEQGQQVVSVDENDSTPSLQPSGIVACTELGKGSVLDRKDSGETVSEDEDQNSCSEPMGQDQNLDSPMADKEKICSLESILSPDNSDGESLDEGSSLPDSQTDSSTVSEKDSHGNEKEESKVGLLAKDEESKLNKICLNEFTESLFKHIEVQDSELSIPEECVDDLPWETTDVYEPDSPPASLPSSERQGSSDGNEELEGPNTPPFTEKVADVDEPESKEYCDAPEIENQVNANKIYQICSEENENFNEYYFREQNPSFNQTLENLNMVTGSDSQCRDEKQDIQTEEGELEELEEHSGYICSEETYTHREKEDIQTEGEEPQKIKEDSEERCIEETFISKEKEDIQTEEEELEDIQTEEEELEDIQTEEEELEDIQTEEEELEEHKEDSDERCTESTALNKRSLEPDSTESSHVFLDENSNGVRTDVEIDEDNSEVSSEKEADEDDTMSSTEIEVDDTLVINQTDEEETEIEPEERLFSTDRETDEEEDMMGSTEIELDIKLVSTELKLVENDVVNPEELDFYDSGLGHETEHGEYSLAGADHDEDIKLACAKKEHDDNEINTEIDEDIYMPIIKIEPQDNSTSIETDKDNDTASTKTAHEDYLDSAEKEIEVDSTIGSAETQIESNNMIDNKIEFDKGQNIPSIEITEVEIDKDSTEIFTEIELSKENVDSTKTEDENDGDEANAETVVNMLCTELEADTDSNEVFTEIKPSEDNMGNSKTETNEDSMINAETVMDEDMSQVSSETESDRDSHNVSTEIELDNDGLNTGVEFDKDSSYLVNTHTEVPNKKTSLVSNECDKDTNMINIEFDQDSKITVAETELDEDIAIVNSEVESHDKESDKNTQETEVYKNEDSRETEEVDINWDSGETEADKNRDNQDTKVVRNGDSRETEIIDRNNDSQETEVQVLDGKKENQETETVDRIEDSRKTAIVDRNDSYEIQRKVSTATDLDKVAYLVTHLEGDTKGSAELKMSHTNSNGITPQRYTDSNGGSSESDRAKVTKLECEENRNENMDTEMDEDVNNKITTKTNPYKESRKFNTRQQYLIRRAVDTPSASEQEEEHDHFDLTHRRIRRQKLQVSFLLSDSGEDTAVSMSSLESLNTQLQEAEKSNYYISLRSPNFWDDSTTDANTDDEYTDPRLLPKDPFSPEEEDFAFSGYISHHSAYDSMTDSEVEGITGRLNKEGAGALQSNQEWRKSDIDLIGENETDKDGGQVTPIPTQFQDDGTQSSQDNMEGSVKLTDVEATLTQYNIESASQMGGDQTSHQHTHQPSSMKKEDISPKDTTENSSPDDALKDIGRSFQEHDKDTKMEQHKPECITSVGHHDSGGQNEPTEPTEGGGEGEGETSLTTELEYVAPLTHTHITGALTQPQVKIHAGKRVNEGGAVPGHYQPVPGPTLWTRHLPSYPVYGPYSVTPATHSTTSQPMGIPGLNGKRLLVKIVKAMGVGCEKPVLEAYSVVEMDEPPQKFTTSVVKDTSSPFWDEQFLFDLSGGTLELLFELYDKSNGTFLGLGIVGIEELVATPSQRQIIPLQSRPYENDEVSGSLTVEFLFLDRADLPEHTLRASTSSKSVTPRGDLITTTTTTYIKAPEVQAETVAVGRASPGPYRRRESYRKANNIRSDPPVADVLVNGGDSVAAAVIRDIEEKKSVVTNNASKSTMIIHASKKPDLDGQGYMADDLYNLAMTATTTGTPTITTTGANTVGTSTTTSTSAATTSPPASTIASSTEPTEDEERGRSRGVRRKRDSFFGTLKKRFSRSKVRSKSMDPGARDTSLERDPSVGRSISMERSSNLNRASGLLSVPSAVGGDAGSTRSSLSDASAISGSSTRTYVNEASTLIIETSENGIFKHYLIPLSLQQKSKWRKKGLKLHIFGEHTFIAKHMSSSTLCEVCQKTLGRRFGKQGYICRDCGYKCHKPCHVKTETTCPNSTVNNMDLEYVRDPKEERRAWLKKTKTT